MQKFLEFQSYFRHRNHFDIDSKQTHFEEIQVIPMESVVTHFRVPTKINKNK